MYYYSREIEATLYCYKYAIKLLEDNFKNNKGFVDISILYPIIYSNLGQINEILNNYNESLKYYFQVNEWYLQRMPIDTNFLIKNLFNIIKIIILSQKYEFVDKNCNILKQLLREKMCMFLKI